MKLTYELKNKINNYFKNIDPNKLVDDLINNFNFKEVEIKNNIKELYCSYEVSKLLIQKGLRLNNPKVAFRERDEYDINNPIKSIVESPNILTCDVKSPSHAYAIEWIRINFNIYLVSWRYPDDKSKYYFEIDAIDKYIGDITLGLFESPHEAIEAGLLYILTKII